MGTVTRAIAEAAVRAAALRTHLDAVKRRGMTLKVNLWLDELPVFRCLPEDRGQFRTTMHLLPQDDPIAAIRRAHADASAGLLPDFPDIEWYTDTVVDAARRGGKPQHSGALFVQWVPYELAGGRSWDAPRRISGGTSTLVLPRDHAGC